MTKLQRQRTDARWPGVREGGREHEESCDDSVLYPDCGGVTQIYTRDKSAQKHLCTHTNEYMRNW